jgi:hypothetical protein
VILAAAEVFSSGAGAGDRKVNALLHLNSNVSSGSYPPEKLADMAREAGVDAVFITENYYPRWEYGAFPLRCLVKRVEERDGLYTYGVRSYSERISELDAAVGDVRVMMSAEVAPYYFWTGDIYEKGLTLNDWDIQFLVFGLEEGEYERLPTVSKGSFSGYTLFSLLELWPLLILAGGIFLLKRKYSRFYVPDLLCWILIIAGAAGTLCHFPFKHTRYDQYGGRDTGPYQEFIDNVIAGGGMLFWSAPESEVYKRMGPVTVASSDASEHMLSTDGYTGFCAFYEGYREVGGPGGVWDVVLNEYCWGERDRPVWTLGEMAYHDEHSSGGKDIDEVRTVFFSTDDSENEIYGAMRQGRMYAVRKGRDSILSLDGFRVTAVGGETAFMGGTVRSEGAVSLDIGVSWEGEVGDGARVRIIRNGKVIKELLMREPGVIEFVDDHYAPGQKVYYRIDIRTEYPGMLFSNPVFVEYE